MPLRHIGKAKAHVFLDVGMEDCIQPTHDYEVRAGAGCKVVITIGPSCQDVPTLVKLLQAGVTCARVDLSWGTKEFHSRSLANLAEAMVQTRRLCSVWLDPTGREVVVRRPVEYDTSGWPRQVDDKMEVHEGQVVTITTDPMVECSPSLLPVNYPGFPDIVEAGQMLQVGRYLATGSEGMSLYLEVVDRSDTSVTCVATNSAVLEGLLTVMVCHTEDEDLQGDFALPLLTEHDVDCIRHLGSLYEVDFVSLSFCNSAHDLYATRALLDSLCMQQTKIIAKIERKAAVRNFEAIAHVADGIIISRGNLGLDFDAEVMALLQKRIISRCNQLGKPVHITRIVDTMVSTPRPTRAEATDVANAVLDGVDGMLLGAETLRGQHPIATVETVLKLAHAAEQYFDYRTHHETLMGEAFEDEVTLGRADVSVSDFRLYGTYGSAAHDRSPDTTLHRHALRASRSYGGALGAAAGAARSSTSEEGGPARPLGPGPGPVVVGNGMGGGGNADGVGGGDRSPNAAEAVSPSSGGVVRGKLSGPAAMAGIGSGPTAGAAMARRAVGAHGPLPLLGAGAGALRAELSAGSVGPSTAPPQPYLSTFGSMPPQLSGSSPQLQRILQTSAPYMSKLESMASSATRTAEKINAGLIIVMVQSGRTVSLVAKYRPPMPILAVVVPQLKATELGWRLEGKYLARQTLALRGVVPMMAAPMSDGNEDLLSEAVHSAYMQRLVNSNDYVVCIMTQRGGMLVKVVQVNRTGTGLKCMGGVNSVGAGNETPDIIWERSPFGAYIPPPSPMFRGGQVPPSPGRTLSGRPSPALGIMAGGATPPPLSLGSHLGVGGGGGGRCLGGASAGAGAGAGSGGGGAPTFFLMSTPSEAQAMDDQAAARVAAELAERTAELVERHSGASGAGPARFAGAGSARSGSTGGSAGGSPPLTSPVHPGAALRGAPPTMSLDPSSPLADAGHGHGHGPLGGLSPISELPGSRSDSGAVAAPPAGAAPDGFLSAAETCGRGSSLP